ncbi:hypothetical protein [Sphingomonas sp.]|nr:hypothetical protein [Sphingomonas sp.]HTG38704.1 hypothetical protein [Sphingomonas sp.]
MTRELVAYSIIAMIGLTGIPWLAIHLRQRRLRNLRRRGIKRYGH